MEKSDIEIFYEARELMIKCLDRVHTDEKNDKFCELIRDVEEFIAEFPAQTGKDWACKLALAQEYLEGAPIFESIKHDMSTVLEQPLHV